MTQAIMHVTVNVSESEMPEVGCSPPFAALDRKNSDANVAK
jgi:hypothetical protein